MREDFLHYLWRHRRFNLTDLSTTDHRPLEILYPGEYNPHAGPDFFNARIRIDETLWAGNVEMHLNASEWLLHRHDTDPAYDNVVLHVVYDNDELIRRKNGELIPCLSLRHRIPPRLLESYKRLENEKTWVPCQSSIAQTPEIVWHNWLDRLLVERLEGSTAAIKLLLDETGRHWEEALYRRLAWNFGLKINADPFQLLAQALPLTLVGRHRNNLFQLEAMFFGQAGFLEKEFTDEYPRLLRKEYSFLQHKYQFTPLPVAHWKFLRLRPANFPTVRIAQFASLLHHTVHLFAEMMEAPDVPYLEKLFAVPVSPYWYTHYQFDRPSTERTKLPGRDLAHSAVINSIAPMLFLYGQAHERNDWQEKALSWLEALPPESNAIIDGWNALGIKGGNAHRTQALLHLKTRYCDAKRCLECAVGNAILRE